MSKRNLVYVALQRDTDAYLKVARTIATFNMPVGSAEAGINRDFIEGPETLGARSQEAQDPGLTRYAGSIPFFVRPNSSPVFFTMAMGEPTTSTPATATTTRDHLFEPDVSTKRPMQATLWLINNDPDPEIQHKIIGAKGNELAIAVGMNTYLSGTLGFLAPLREAYTGADTTTVTKDAGRRFTYVQTTATISITGVGSLAPIALNSFDFNWNNNIVDDLGELGSTELTSTPESDIESTVSFTATQNSELNEHYERALLELPDDVTLRLTASGAIIEAALHNEFEITLYKAHYREASGGDITAGDVTRALDITARPVLDESQTPDKSVDVRFRNVNTGATYLAPTS